MKKQLQRFTQLWNRGMEVLSNVMSRVILSIVYIIIVPPFALLVRLFREPLATPTVQLKRSAYSEAAAHLEPSKRLDTSTKQSIQQHSTLPATRAPHTGESFWRLRQTDGQTKDGPAHLDSMRSLS